MQPAAVTKAEALLAHAKHCGVPPTEFVLTITLGEAYELLDYLAREHPHNRVLHADIAAAKADSDPWPVLANFRLQGFEIARADLLH